MLNKENNKKTLIEKFSENSIIFKDNYDEITINKNDILKTIQELKGNQSLGFLNK